jgi:hypothetical protein
MDDVLMMRTLFALCSAALLYLRHGCVLQAEDDEREADDG